MEIFRTAYWEDRQSWGKEACRIISFSEVDNKWANSKKKQARKGFRPPSAMFVIISFWIFLEFFERIVFGGLFGRNFFSGIFWEKFFGGVFWEDLLGGFFWEEFNKKLFEYGRNLFVCKDFGFCQDFRLRKGRRKFKSLEVQLQVHRN